MNELFAPKPPKKFPEPQAVKPIFPSLKNALDPLIVQNNAFFWLRMLQKKHKGEKYLELVTAEMAIKNGQLDAVTAVRNALLKVF